MKSREKIHKQFFSDKKMSIRHSFRTSTSEDYSSKEDGRKEGKEKRNSRLSVIRKAPSHPTSRIVDNTKTDTRL